MSSLVATVPNAVLNLTTRNREAETIISRFANRHAWMDAGIGLVGGIVPGGGIASMVASILAQAPLVYQPMVKQLATVYSADPDEVRDIVGKAVMQGTFADTLSYIGSDLAAAFGAEFFVELAPELVQEMGVGAVLTLIPIVGGVASAIIDVVIARHLTWRVGRMTELFFLNNCAWVRGSRQETYGIAKQLDGVDLDAVPGRVSQVMEAAVPGLATSVRLMQNVQPHATRDQLRNALLSEGVPSSYADAALRRASIV